MAERKKRYVQVGLGARSGIYTRALTQTYSEFAQLVGICDSNPGRMAFCNRRFSTEDRPIPTYPPEQFDRMIAEVSPDGVIVSSVDSTHAEYICRAMERGCDVITEKPMTIDAAGVRKILRTMKTTGKNVFVTFNARYAPARTQIRELLASHAVGEVLSVDFAWHLDTRHGADYFRRWHRYRKSSGSLLVHKATHHFDLVNWWLDDVPEEVFAHGSLKFYTPRTGDRLGLQGRTERCLTCPHQKSCPFFFDLTQDDGRKAMYLDCEGHDGYFRDRCVFAADIDIWDSMSLSVRYRRGAVMSYLLHAYSPWEGYGIAFNGTAGKLEHHTRAQGLETGLVPGENRREQLSTVLSPLFGESRSIPVIEGEGGHGGGDPLLASDLFNPDAGPDPLGRKAGALAGAYSVLIGAAACQSIDTGKAVRIDALLKDPPQRED